MKSKLKFKGMRHPNNAIDLGLELIKLSIELISVPKHNQLSVNDAIMS